MADETTQVVDAAGASPEPGKEAREGEEAGGGSRPLITLVLATVLAAAGIVIAASLVTDFLIAPKASAWLIAKEIKKLEAAEEVPAADFGNVHLVEDMIVNPAGSAGLRYVCVSLGLETRDVEVLHELDRRSAQVKDTLIKVLSSRTTEQLVDVDSREVMRSEIRDRINQIMPTGGVNAVYFVNFVLQ